MIVIVGGVQAAVRIDMSMPKAPDPKGAGGAQGGVSPWEREAYGEGGRFGNMQMMPSGDPSQDRISVRYSGCGYNVAKLLAAKGRPVTFVSVVGEDPLGLAAIADLQRAGINTDHIRTIDAFRAPANADSLQAEGPDAAGTVANGLIRQSLTSVLVEAKNFLGDTEFWREDDRMLEEITVDQIAEDRPLFAGADLVFADGALPPETLAWIADVCQKAQVRFYLDPASVSGGEKAGRLLDAAAGTEEAAAGAGERACGGGTDPSAAASLRLHGIMPGRREAEAMSGLQILSTDQLMEAGAYFADKGVQQIIITMKGGGLYYKEGLTEGVLRPDRVLRFSETVGAGDVVTAALLDVYADGGSIEEAARQAMDAAAQHLADCVDERRY